MSPSISDNYWNAVHRRGGRNKIISSEIFAGWKIVPQLRDLRIFLSTTKPAGALATIEFSFTPTTAAKSLRIEAKKPVGFNFAQAGLPVTGQDVNVAVDALLRVAVDIVPDVPTLIRVQ